MLVAFVTPAIIISSMNIVFAMAESYLSFVLIFLFFAMGPVLWYIRLSIRQHCDGGAAAQRQDDDMTKDDESARLLKLVRS